MAFKRKRFMRPRRFKKRRMFRKRPPRQYNRYRKQPLYHYKRMMNQINVTGAVGLAPLLNGYTVAFNEVRGFTEFTALYDYYRINKVVYKFWLEDDTGAQAAASATVPTLYWFIDHDDATTPSGLDELRERSNTKFKALHAGKPVTIVFRPSVLANMFNGVTDAYVPKYKQWLDMAYTGVPHYGLKWAINDFTNTNYTLRIERYCYFSCKTPL